MNQLSSELLLPIFKCLDSREMVNVMRVRKKWLETIDENMALWRRLVLPDPIREKVNGGWDPSIVELSDRKSNSSLKEVSMQTRFLKSKEVEALIKVLEKSKKTLRILRLKVSGTSKREALAELSLKLLDLKDCQFVATIDGRGAVDLVHRDSKEAEAGDQSHTLRILWCPDFDTLRKSFSHLFPNLVSLGLDSYLSPSTWRKILKSPSKVLRHLKIYTTRPHPGDLLLPPIELPNLEILEIGTDRFTEESSFPSWIRVGHSLSTFICHDYLYPSFPSVSTLWIDHPEAFERLADKCPEMIELRFCPDYHLTKKTINALISLIKQRKRDIENGVEIDGVKMVHLKRLIINSSHLKSSKISELKQLVEEVLDFPTAHPIELEI